MKCEVCKQPMTPGIDGITFGKVGVHDTCGNIVRCANGYIWSPADIERGYIVLTDPKTGAQQRLAYTPREEVEA